MTKNIIDENIYNRYSRISWFEFSRILFKKKFTVSGCDNLVGGSLENLKGLNVNFHKGDCENLSFMSKVLKDHDVVIHAADILMKDSSISPNIICKSIFSGSVSVFTARFKIS